MDSNARESPDARAEFRKPTNDAANRKYRRRSPVGGSSSSSDGSPVPLRKENARVADDKRKRDDDRSLSGRNDEPYKYSDQQSSRSHYRHDDRGKRDRHVDDYDRRYSKSSYRSRDSRGNNNLDYSKSDKELKSRDYVNDVDTYSHGKSDGLGSRSRDKDSYDRAGSGRRYAAFEERDRERNREGKVDRFVKTDIKKSSADRRSDRSPAYEESKGIQNDSFARRDSSGPRVKEANWRDGKELDFERNANEVKRRDDDRGRYKEQGNREPKEHSDDKGQNYKKTKFVRGSTSPGTDAGTSVPAVTDSDIDAARIAAIKAAELVNKNLVGTGYMSTDQKKKLLWGSKKSTATEESTAHRWDTPMFGDLERQEKFNKLMSLRLHWWPIVGRERGSESGRQPRCRQATRETSDGSRETVYSWTASERWSNCWTRSLDVRFRYLHACTNVFLVKKLVCKIMKSRT